MQWKFHRTPVKDHHRGNRRKWWHVAQEFTAGAHQLLSPKTDATTIALCFKQSYLLVVQKAPAQTAPHTYKDNANEYITHGRVIAYCGYRTVLYLELSV